MSTLRRTVQLMFVLAIACGGAAHAYKTQRVVIGTLSKYTYKNVFSLDAPTTWSRKDNSHGGEAIHLWTDPTGNGVLVVDVFDAGQAMSAKEQIDLLQKFLKKAIGKHERFTQQARREGPGAFVAWSYWNSKIKVKMQGRSYIRQRGKRLSIVTYGVPAEQFPSLQQGLTSIVQSLRVMSGPI